MIITTTTPFELFEAWSERFLTRHAVALDVAFFVGLIGSILWIELEARRRRRKTKRPLRTPWFNF